MEPCSECSTPTDSMYQDKPNCLTTPCMILSASLGRPLSPREAGTLAGMGYKVHVDDLKIEDKDKRQEFVVKDSGQRKQFESGMVRDITDNKTDYSLVYDGPMLHRWAEHITKGARKYTKRNWMQAAGQAELERFKESAARHFAQWMRGEADEDHAAAVIFNINGAEYVKQKMEGK